jgi:hypothetical protein
MDVRSEVAPFVVVDVKIGHMAASESAALEAVGAVLSPFGVPATMRGLLSRHRRRPRASRGDGARIFGGLRRRRTAIVATKSVVVAGFTDGGVIRDESPAITAPPVKLSPKTS